MNKLLIITLLSLMLGTQAQAICLRTTTPYSGIVPANSQIVAYGPFSAIKDASCLSIAIESRVEATSGRYTPALTLEVLNGSNWQRVLNSTSGNITTTIDPGTYRIIHINNSAASVAYTGSTALKR